MTKIVPVRTIYIVTHYDLTANWLSSFTYSTLCVTVYVAVANDFTVIFQIKIH